MPILATPSVAAIAIATRHAVVTGTTIDTNSQASKVRILYLHRTQGEEPESIHIAAIVDALRALGHQVLVVGPTPLRHRDNGKPRRSWLGQVKKIVPQAGFELLQMMYNLLAYWRLSRAADTFQPELIYERYALFSFAGVLLAKRRAIPLILEVNTPYAQAWAAYYGLWFKRLARWSERCILMTAGHIITVTNVQRDMLAAEGIPLARISVCHNAIDPAWFSPTLLSGASDSGPANVPATVIGFVGTMNRWQGITEFPEVMRKVFARCDDAAFLFVGDGEFRQFLEEFCRSEGYAKRVVFSGRQPHAEIPALVARMDITVLLNSNAYGSPMKIFEYMGMGKAVIAPAVKPVLEILTDGKNGLLIAPGDAARMADQIIRLIQDKPLRDRLGQAGRAYVMAHHTWQQNAAKIEQIFVRHLRPDDVCAAAESC